MKNKRNISLIIAAFVIIIVSVIAVKLIIKKPLLANPGFTFGSVTVQVIEDGKPGIGTLVIKDDCTQPVIYPRNGVYNCYMSHAYDYTDHAYSGIGLRYITYLSPITHTGYDLPINHSNPAEVIVLPTNTFINLVYTINSDGTTNLSQWVNNQLVDITSSGLIH